MTTPLTQLQVVQSPMTLPDMTLSHMTPMAQSRPAPSPLSPSPLAPSRLAQLRLAQLSGSSSRRFLPLFLLALAACHRPDFTEATTPVASTSLALVSTQVADTAFVDVTLGGGAPVAIGSFTGEVVHDGAWRFVACDAQQPQALLACKDHGSTVRVAAAWAGGTHAGALVRLSYVRTAPTGPATWTFAVSEAHGARGTPLLENVEVKRLSVEARK